MEAVRKKINRLKNARDNATNDANAYEADFAEKVHKAEELETRLESLRKELADLEDNLDSAESKMIALVAKCRESEKKMQEDSQAKRFLENRKNNDEVLTTKMTAELKDLKHRSAEFELKIDKLSETNRVGENKIEEDEEKAETLKHRAKELEMQMTNSGNMLRSLQLNEIVSTGRNTIVDKKICEITESLKEMNLRADAFEANSSDLDKRTEEKETELLKLKENYIHSRNEFDTLLSEIGEL